MLAISLTIACSCYIYNGVILHAHPVRGESDNQRNATGEVATVQTCALWNARFVLCNDSYRYLKGFHSNRIRNNCCTLREDQQAIFVDLTVGIGLWCKLRLNHRTSIFFTLHSK